MSERLLHRETPVLQVIEEQGVARAIGIKHVASVLYTYRCTLACRHCCFNCAPSRPDVRVSLEDGLEYLRQLHTLDRVVHIAGGEAMIYYDDLIALCRVAGHEGAAPHFVETNTTWCTDNEIARRRLSELRDAGVLGLLLSADPYHQLGCPPERYRLCYEVAADVFGEQNVAGANYAIEELRDFAAIARDEARLRAYALANPPCLTGRAGDSLAGWFTSRPIEELASDSMWHGPGEGMSCRKEFDPEEIWEIHIDPYGNYQTCCGIILGNAREISLTELWRRGFVDGNPVVEAVHRAGPLGLLELAADRGYVPRSGYPQKCGMCWELRKFLRPFFPEVIGPDEVYEPA